MNKIQSTLPLTLPLAGITALASLLVSQMAQAHGYVEYPKARQQFCVEDGGYWWPDDGSNIPNAACRAAFLESGTYAFTQHHEFSANVANYNNMTAVQATVTDGSLCAAGDSAKSGMDTPHADWQKTLVTPNNNGELELIFHASTPHNPSFWEFYLTRPGFDASQSALNWHDLELIDTASNTPVESVNGHKVYRLKVSLPSNRAGDAILYTRWQREDAAGEGFYNCSDIQFTDAAPQWYDNGYLLPQGTDAQPGDTVWFRVFDNNGQENVFETLSIDANNEDEAVWGQSLANTVNTQHNQWSKIGVLQTNGSITFDTTDLRANKIWLSDANGSAALDIKRGQDNLPPSVSLPATHAAGPNATLTLSVAATDPENDALTYQWQVPAPLTAQQLDQPSVDISTHAPTHSEDFLVEVLVSDGTHTVTASTTLTVSGDTANCQVTDPNAGNYPAWVSGSTYTQGQQVSHQQLVWQANWWTTSEPTHAADAWALISQVSTPWQSGRGYQANDEVDHSNRRWRANWWTQAEPGTDGSWQDIGPAECQ